MDISYQIPRNSLFWVLLCVTLVILPQVINTPFWVSIIALICIAWRLLIFSGVLNYPGRMLRVLIVIFTLIVSASQISNIGVGLDSAASLLTLGFVFKLIEMRYKRDIYVVISLCFVMSMIAFIYTQSFVMTVYLAVVITFIIGAMISLNRSSLVKDNFGTYRMAGKIFLQALPLTVVLFMVFPRIAPLWAVPIPNTGNTTGVTDEMSPGSLSQLGRSADLAFRVQFENVAPPLHENLYWRGLVLDRFDGETWDRRRGRGSFGNGQFGNAQFLGEETLRVESNPIRYNVILEPTQQPWVYGLHLAEAESRNLFQSNRFELFNNGPVTQRLNYDLRSYLGNTTNLFLLNYAREANLQLPLSGNERSIEFAREMRASVNTDRDFVYQVLAYFQQNEFFYTLNPALLNENRVDEFLFDTMEGFCEHYASSFAFLMRAAGIPARVVVGYQGAEYNRFEDYMMIYQYNAHAWNEVWLEGEGWVRFDPTAAVSPERIRLGVEAALGSDPAFLQDSMLSQLGFGSMGWLNTLRLRFDAIEYEWNRRVVNYDEEVQFDFFERILGNVTEQKVMALFIGLTAIVIFGIALTVIRFEPRTRVRPVNKLYLEVCAELGRRGLARQRGETPSAYCDRVVAAQPELRQAMTELTELFLDLNYRLEEGPGHEGQGMRQLRQQAGVVKRQLRGLRFQS